MNRQLLPARYLGLVDGATDLPREHVLLLFGRSRQEPALAVVVPRDDGMAVHQCQRRRARGAKVHDVPSLVDLTAASLQEASASVRLELAHDAMRDAVAASLVVRFPSGRREVIAPPVPLALCLCSELRGGLFVEPGLLTADLQELERAGARILAPSRQRRRQGDDADFRAFLREVEPADFERYQRGKGRLEPGS
ncbi:MAG: hypothetical protein FJZ01_03305 [Candidatus Sericytochromatia bacterium]|nr:hypothetical protein [Candidatus Tanganyikabacteria bacterium]